MKKNNKKIDELLGRPLLPYSKFHEWTKIKKAVLQIDEKNWPEEWTKIYYKSYARLKEVNLPQPSIVSSVSLKEALEKRNSRRNFSKRPLSLKSISNLLYYSSGLKNKDNKNSSRFYPSAGARYPLEVYLLSLNTDLPKGLYHYYVKSHSLETLALPKSIITNAYFTEEWIANAACIVIITAVFKRTIHKYSDRGYRYILTEAGHLGQNFSLLSSALDIKCCSNEGFLDDKLNQLLDIDGIDESVVYTLVLGN